VELRDGILEGIGANIYKNLQEDAESQIWDGKIYEPERDYAGEAQQQR
jgi:hypothetical protein